MRRPAKDRPLELRFWMLVMDLAAPFYWRPGVHRLGWIYLWAVGKASECWAADDEVRADGIEEPF